MPDGQRLRLGISACLVGQRVRYDGGHKLDAFLNEVLGRYVEWVAICPEIEIGMGTPREPVRLEKQGLGVRMVGLESRKDWTDRMQEFSRTTARSLDEQRLSGFVFKSRSPSCGLEGVSVVGSRRSGQGLFASAITSHLPLLPIEEESGLADASRREGFIERIFAYRRLEDFFSKKRTPGQIAMFNAQHRLQLRVHSISGQQELSRLVSEGNRIPWGRLRELYRDVFMRVLNRPSTQEGNEEALRYASAHLEKLISAQDQTEVDEAIDAYSEGRTPLVVPIKLLSHHVRTTDSPFLKGQTYLQPDPNELMLRAQR